MIEAIHALETVMDLSDPVAIDEQDLVEELEAMDIENWGDLASLCLQIDDWVVKLDEDVDMTETEGSELHFREDVDMTETEGSELHFPDDVDMTDAEGSKQHFPDDVDMTETEGPEQHFPDDVDMTDAPPLLTPFFPVAQVATDDFADIEMLQGDIDEALLPTLAIWRPAPVVGNPPPSPQPIFEHTPPPNHTLEAPPVQAQDEVSVPPLYRSAIQPTSPTRRPVKRLHPKTAVQRAAHAMRNRDYRTAYILYSHLHQAHPRREDLLERVGDCLFGLGYPEKAQKVYRKLLRNCRSKPRYMEKLADCFARRGFVIQARIIYRKLITRFPDSAAVYAAKLHGVQDTMMKGNTWRSFYDLLSKTGIRSNKTLTDNQKEFIAEFHRKVLHKQMLAWDILMKKTSKFKEGKGLAPFRRETIRDARGERYTVYTKKDFPVLAHFTPPANAAKILATEARRAPSVLTDPNNFWNCQLKVCASLVTASSENPVGSFYSGKTYSEPGIGFILHVPDVMRNLVHVYQEDAYTPTTVVGSAAQHSVTESTGAESVERYNNFMYRFQVVASYIYTAFQEAEKLERAAGVRQDLLKLEELFQNVKDPSLVQQATAAIWNLLSDVAPILDRPKAKLQPLFAELRTIVGESKGASQDTQVRIHRCLSRIEKVLQEHEGESTRSKRIREASEEIQAGMIAGEMPTSSTSRTRLKGRHGMERSMLLNYLDEMERIISKLQREGKIDDREAFERVFHRKQPRGTLRRTTLQEIRDVRLQLMSLYRSHRNMLIKSNREMPGIFARMPTPNETLKVTDKYNEVGVRTHYTAKDVGAAAPDFAGIVIERKTALVSDRFGEHHYLHPQVAPIIQQAQRLGWNVLMI